jgi:hypothetical protein
MPSYYSKPVKTPLSVSLTDSETSKINALPVQFEQAV